MTAADKIRRTVENGRNGSDRVTYDTLAAILVELLAPADERPDTPPYPRPPVDEAEREAVANMDRNCEVCGAGDGAYTCTRSPHGPDAIGHITGDGSEVRARWPSTPAKPDAATVNFDGLRAHCPNGKPAPAVDLDALLAASVPAATTGADPDIAYSAHEDGCSACSYHADGSPAPSCPEGVRLAARAAPVAPACEPGVGCVGAAPVAAAISPRTIPDHPCEHGTPHCLAGDPHEAGDCYGPDGRESANLDALDATIRACPDRGCRSCEAGRRAVGEARRLAADNAALRAATTITCDKCGGAVSRTDHLVDEQQATIARLTRERDEKSAHVDKLQRRLAASERETDTAMRRGDSLDKQLDEAAQAHIRTCDEHNETRSLLMTARLERDEARREAEAAETRATIAARERDDERLALSDAHAISERRYEILRATARLLDDEKIPVHADGHPLDVEGRVAVLRDRAVAATRTERERLIAQLRTFACHENCGEHAGCKTLLAAARTLSMKPAPSTATGGEVTP